MSQKYIHELTYLRQLAEAAGITLPLQGRYLPHEKIVQLTYKLEKKRIAKKQLNQVSLL